MAVMNIKPFQVVITLLYFECLTEASKNEPEEIYAVLGENISFGCYFNRSESSFTLSWLLNEALILFHDPQSHKEENTIGSLTSVVTSNGTSVRLWIRRVQFKDAGSYACHKDFIRFGLPVSCVWELKVQDVPEIIMEENMFIEKTAVLAECCVEYSLELTDRNITWLISGDRNFPKKSSSPKTVSHRNSERVCSTLTFQSSRQYHKKYLQCYAENELNLSSSSIITVKYPSQVDLLSEKYMTVQMNNLVNITCTGKGNPLPVIGLQRRIDRNNWANLSVEAKQLSSTETSSTKSFSVVQIPARESIFRCTAFNNIGSSAVSEEMKITVKSLATVQMLTVSPIIVDNKNVVIECGVSGVPAPDVYLQKKLATGSWITLTEEPSSEKETSKWIFNISEEHTDGDSFRCIANNTLDDMATSKFVVVQYRVSLTDLILKNLEVIVTATVVTVSIVLTACFVRYCRARCLRQQNRAGTQGTDFRDNNGVNDDYEQPPRPPTRLRLGNCRPVPTPRTNAENQSVGVMLPQGGYSSATLPASGTVNINVGTYGVKYATVEKKHLQESPYY